MRRTILTGLVLAAAAVGAWWTRDAGREPVRLQRALMGTLWSIQVEDAGSQPAIRDAFEEVARIEAVMSEWREDSPLSAINAAAGETSVAVPAELREILLRAIEFGRKSEGAFDVTWRGMGKLWSFQDPFTAPDEQAIESARRRVDYRRIRIEGDRVGLPRRDMALGLGGIAKGYAVDRAAQVLREAGYENFLVEGGGDIVAWGRRAGEPWRIGLRDPRSADGDLMAILRVSRGAVASSGDYERFRVVDGVRYHHIIDPRTGRPARKCRSVTVLAPRAEVADALATAIFVLGPEKGLDLAREHNAEALVIDGQGGRHLTPGLRERIEFLGADPAEESRQEPRVDAGVYNRD